MKSDHIQGHQPHFNKFIVKELKQYIFLDQKRIEPEKNNRNIPRKSSNICKVILLNTTKFKKESRKL